MKGYQELCKALGLRERAAKGSVRVPVAPSNDHKHAEEPCPEELAVLALLRRA